MEWNDIQNFLSNVVFGVLLITMIFYWMSLILFKNPLLSKIGKIGSIISNVLLFVILGSRWVVAGYFPLSNLYVSLFSLAWRLRSAKFLLNQKLERQLSERLVSPFQLRFVGLVLPKQM